MKKGSTVKTFNTFIPADTLELYYIDASGNQTAVPLVKKGIAWWTDKHVKFRNPGGSANLSVAFQGDSIKPLLRNHCM